MEEFYTVTSNIDLPKKYVIFDCSEIYKLDFNQVMETSPDTLKKSLNGSKTFVKYVGEMPSCVKLINLRSQEYTHDEIITILNTSEWYIPQENQ